ncbi:MAG: hypothetical protein Q4E65_01870 [Clostridia bacterium]|nr:hypothetical protein [Clostridia bacterium]
MKRNPARMKYQKDTRSSLLCILSILFNVYYFISVFRSGNITPDVVMGLDVIINIVFMMLVFLTSEKLKAYAPKWNRIAAALGVFEALRVFILPLHYHKLGMLTGGLYMGAVAALLLAALCLIGAGVNATINGRLLRREVKAAGGE